MDYGRVLAAHVARQADLTVACIEVPLAEASSFGVMSVDEAGRVLEFTEKPAQPQHMPGNPAQALASMGIYVFNTNFLIEQLLRDADDPKSSHDFGKDVIPHCVKRYRTFAQNFAESCVTEPDKPAYWRDVGTLDAYWAANMDLIQVTPLMETVALAGAMRGAPPSLRAGSPVPVRTEPSGETSNAPLRV